MIGFFLTVGPREGEICVDAVESILRYYPEARIWIRDDHTSDGTFEMVEQLAGRHAHRIDLVRNASPMGKDGIAVSAFRTLHRICQSPYRLEMLIQLDPDVWLRDGIVEFARAKFSEHGPGIIGSYTLSPSKTLRSHTVHRNNMLRDLFPIGRDAGTRKVRVCIPFYLKYLPAAIKGGYQLGHHVLAAFYIIHGETLYALNALGFWNSIPDTGSKSVKEDDPLVSLGAYVAGHKLIELHDKVDSRFWVQLSSPIPLSAEEIAAKGYLAVHPLKSDEAARRLRSELARALQVTAD